MNRSHDRRAHLERARTLVNKGKLTRAIEAYRRLIELDPSDAQTWLRIAELCVKTVAHRDAAEAYLEAAHAFQKKGFRDRAIAAYERVLSIAPRSAGVRMEVGELLVAAGRVAEAKQHFQAAAAAYCAKERVPETLDATCRLAELSPDDYELRGRLAKMYADNGFPDEAAKHYEAAWNRLHKLGAKRPQLRVGCAWIAVAPDNLDLTMQVGELYLELGEPTEALRLLRDCYRHRANDPHLLDCVARALTGIGQHDKAQQARARRAKLLGESPRREPPRREPPRREPPPPRQRMAAGSERHRSIDVQQAPVHALIQLAHEAAAASDRERALTYLQRALMLEPGNTEVLQLAQRVAGYA